MHIKLLLVDLVFKGKKEHNPAAFYAYTDVFPKPVNRMSRKCVFRFLFLLPFLTFLGMPSAHSQLTADIEESELPQATPHTDSTEVVIFPDDPVLAAMDSLWITERLFWEAYKLDSTCLNVYNFAPGEIPTYPDSVIAARLGELNKKTPLNLDYNPYVKAYINVYVERRREISERALGLAKLYYPLFEEKLDMFDIPLELKHLAVVESALNPTARSRMGAAGLWQFMYNTGRIYGLEVNSYVDDRNDPYKSTVAACRYMRFLYGMYGDWNLVLAAYNSGPGNVNKAIRRSGGHRDYWKIRPYLPRETRGYVPAFIAVNYMMNYASEHNLYPLVPTHVFEEIDTVRVCRETTFQRISQFTGVAVADLERFNPSLKRNVIPETQTCRTVYLPIEAIGKFLANEDSMYHFQQEPQTIDGYVVEDVVERYTVRRGDVLGVIAQRHGVTVSQLRAWNNIHGNRIYPGQKLEIRKTLRREADKKGETLAAKSNDNQNVRSQNDGDDKYRFHTIQQGDTLWDIAKQYPGISVEDLKVANADLDTRRLKPGQQIKIPPAS